MCGALGLGLMFFLFLVSDIWSRGLCVSDLGFMDSSFLSVSFFSFLFP